MILEACVENYSEALNAEAAGATRIELCENLAVGGTTPSYGTIRMCCSNLKIPIAAMIRPRGGDFVYTGQEFEIMKSDISICKGLGVQGVVFGLLTNDRRIDIEKTKELVQLAQLMQTVFHKAFDELSDPFEGLEQLIELGITRVLTSGTKETALEGKDVLNKLIKLSAGRISILVAGKVTYENISDLRTIIPAHEFHGRRIVKMF